MCDFTWNDPLGKAKIYQKKNIQTDLGMVSSSPLKYWVLK